MKKYNEMTDEQLKEEFIKYFGEEKWNESEILGDILPTQFRLCEYLRIEPIPVVVEEMKEDSRYYTKENYIAISKTKINDKTEALKCLIHETRHYYQYLCVINNYEEEPLYKIWKDDFKSEYEKISDENKPLIPIEIDAFAFTKYIMNIWFEIIINHPNEMYDGLLDLYIEKYFTK